MENPNDPNSPFHGDVMATIASSLSKSFGGGQPPPVDQPPVTQPPPVEQPPVTQPPVTQPAQPPQEIPTVSTQPVGDVSAMFSDKVTQVPEVTPASTALPPDTPIEDPPDLQTEKAKNAWQELKQREKQSRRAAQEMQAQLEEMKKAADQVAAERVKFADELKQRDDRIKELDDELGKLTLEHRPEFREKYDKPLDEVAGQVEATLRAATDITDEKQLAELADDLLSASDSDFTTMVSKLPAPVQGSLLNSRNSFAQLMSARNNAISEWRATQAGVTETNAQEQIVERAARRRDMAEAAIEFTTRTMPSDQRPPVLLDPTFAKDVENVTQSFRGFMQEAKDEAIARAAFQGFLMPVMKRQIALLAEGLEEWKAAYYATKGIRNPPALAMRVQTGEGVAPVSTPPPAIEPGQNFKSTVENTVAATLKRSGLM